MMKLNETMQQSDNMMVGGQAEAAVTLLSSFLKDHDNPVAWRKLARCYMILGEEVISRAILRSVWRRLDDPHILELILAGVPVGKPHIFEKSRLIFFSVPKAGSSTIKDAFLISQGGKPVGELSHHRTSHFSRAVPFSEIGTVYSDYESFSIIRHPRERLRSYWRKNINEAESLKYEARGQESFYGLSTRPSYEQVVDNFERYRNVFLDFRHHTDTLIGFLGRNPHPHIQIFEMGSLASAITLISARSGVVLPKVRNMQSRQETLEVNSALGEKEQELVETQYKAELEVFGASFEGR